MYGTVSSIQSNLEFSPLYIRIFLCRCWPCATLHKHVLESGEDEEESHEGSFGADADTVAT